jgi:transcriptional regulator with XRE-family HTH domain
MLSEYINKLKALKGFTNAQTASASGVSESTVSRLTRGDFKTADFDSVLRVITALGGSLDEAAGIVRESQNVSNGTPALDIEAYLSSVEARASQTFMRHFEEHTNIIHRERVESLREIIAHKDKTIRMLLIALFVALGILVGQWILDALIGTSGWVRY